MMEFDQDCEICQRLPSPDWVLHETDHWKVVLGREQRYLGRSFVALKRHADDLADISQAEWIDFQGVVKAYEALLR